MKDLNLNELETIEEIDNESELISKRSIINNLYQNEIKLDDNRYEINEE